MRGDRGDVTATDHRRSLVLLAAAGAVLVAACWGLARVPNLALAPRTFLVLFCVALGAHAVGVAASMRVHGRVAVAVILTAAGLARLALLPAEPSLSTDVYRYVWDARVAHAGIDPYAHPPSAPSLVHLRDATLYPKQNHPTWQTVYPPVAQAFFLAVYRAAPDSVFALKAVLCLAEAVALVVLLRLLGTLGAPPGRLTIYAWSPLVLVEVWGSAHLDALVILMVVAAALASARGRDGVAAVWLGAGTLLKLYPAILLLLLPGRRRPAVAALFAGTIAAGTVLTGGVGRWPFGPIARYVADEYFNPGLVRSVVNEPRLALAATVAWVLFLAWRMPSGTLAARATPMIAGFVALASNVFPWYALWLVPFLAVTPSVPLIAFTGALGFAYAFFLSEPWGIPLWARLLQAAPLAAAVAVSVRGWRMADFHASVRPT